jgi:hypothetical protein
MTGRPAATEEDEAPAEEGEPMEEPRAARSPLPAAEGMAGD